MKVLLMKYIGRDAYTVKCGNKMSNISYIGEDSLFNKIVEVKDKVKFMYAHNYKFANLECVSWNKFCVNYLERQRALASMENMSRVLKHNPTPCGLSVERLQYVSKFIQANHGRSAHLRRLIGHKGLVFIKGTWINIGMIEDPKLINDINIFLDSYNKYMIKLWKKGGRIMTIGEWRKETLDSLTN